MVDCKEVGGFDLGTAKRLAEIRQPSVECVGPQNLDARLATEPAPGAHKEQHGMNWPPGAQFVIGTEVPGVRRDLIEIGLSRAVLALGFDDDDAAAHQKEGVWTTVIQRQLIFKDRSVRRSCRVSIEDLTYLALQGRDRLVPGAYLLDGRIRQERCQLIANVWR